MRSAWIAAPALFLLLLATGVPARAAEPDRDRLVGAWRFEKETLSRPDGTPIEETAIPSAGFLVYTSDGFLSVQILPRGRQWTAGRPSYDELRATLDEGTSYAGRYELDPQSHTVTHQVEVCLDPAYEGKRLVRRYAFEGDALLLSGDATANGQPIRFTIKWVRASGGTKG